MTEIRSRIAADSLVASDMLLGYSASIRLGKLETLSLLSVYEFKAMHYKVSYGAWEDPFTPAYEDRSNISIPIEYARYRYNYDLINDLGSAKRAVNLTLASGHPSLFSTVERYMSATCHLSALRFRVCDLVLWRDFPYLTTESDSLFDADTMSWLHATGDKDFVRNGFGVINRLSLSLTAEQALVEVEAKATHAHTPALTTLRTEDPFDDPVPDLPPDPPNDPDEGPNGPGGEPTTPTGPYGFPKMLNVDVECQTDCALDSDAGLVVDVKARTQDFFTLGFVADFHYIDENDNEVAFMTHSVSNGTNISSPVITQASIPITSSWFKGRRSRVLLIRVDITVNAPPHLSASTIFNSTRTYEKYLSLDTPPAIVAS